MFSDDERRTFRYRLPDADRYADPLECLRSLHRSTGGRLDELLDRQRAGAAADRSGDAAAAAAALDAEAKLVAAAREAFGLAAIDPASGSGVTYEEAWGVLCQFLEYLRGKASRPGNSPSSSGPTASAPGPSATRTSSDCGCGSPG